MSFYESEPLPINELFKKSWNLYKPTLKYVWIWSLFNTALFLLIDLLDLKTVGSFIQWKHFSFEINITIFFIVFFLTWSFFRTVIMVHMHYYAIKRPHAFSKSIIISLKKLLPVTIASLVYQLFIFGGLFLFIIPGIYFGIVFFMYLPILIFEDESWIQSFIKSFKLIAGSWWETFMLIVLPTAAIYLIRELIRRYFFYNAPMLTICIILLILIIPYSYALLLIQYHNLKVKVRLAKISTLMDRR